MITAPASRSRATMWASRSAGRSKHAVPWLVISPATSTPSLIAIGTPPQRQLAVSPPRRVGGVRLGERLLGHHDAKGVQLRVETLDPLEVELDQLARGDVAGAHERGLAHDPGEGELGRIHRGREPNRPPVRQRLSDRRGARRVRRRAASQVPLPPIAAAASVVPAIAEPAAELLEAHHAPALVLGDRRRAPRRG